MRKFFYRLLVLLAIPFALIGLSADSALSEKEPLVFAGNESFAPYSFLSEGRPAGYSVDIVTALSGVIDRDITIKLMPWDKCVSELRTGEVDGLIGCPVSEEIEQYADFSTPVTNEYALAVRKGETVLLDDINRGITALEEKGTLEKLKRKWFGIPLAEPFPWKMVSMAIGAIMGVMLLLMALLWVTSLNATINLKTRQIQIMNRKMVEKDKLAVLGKLAGEIAHELRTPLSIINNYLFLLRKDGREDRELFEKRLRIMEDKIKLSSSILESILGYSRVKAEIATTVSLKECVGEVLKHMDIPEGIEKDLSFKKEETLLVFMDFHQLYSVLRNLILNAVEAMAGEGALTIRAFLSDAGSTVNVRVCDTGCGITESARKKIFDLFYSSKTTGTGLGLSISKSIIEANGGQLYLEKTSEKGSCFAIKLPRSRMPAK